ncbi:GntR family transcriptional regulator [Rhizobium mongolense]|uniref:GntR family transcriptional regulator n=1 Tax=Rhizobium mongolense TaxID=57676 RepID=UPI00355654D5
MRSSNDSVVVAELRRRLFLGDLRPGSPIHIANIADDVGVSTAPVRDALIRLSERGLITRVEGRGFFVASTPDHEASELLGILHKIVTFSIERGRPANGIDRPEEKRDGPTIPVISNAHDKLNEMLEQICSPPVATVATSIADRLWDVRRRIAEQSGVPYPESKLVQVVTRSLARSDRKMALLVVNTSYQFCQQFLMKQIVNS